MKKYLLALLFVMFMASSVFGQGLTVVASAGVQQTENLGFVMQINAQGPNPISGVSLNINGKTVEGLIVCQVKVLDPTKNLTMFAITRQPGIIMKAGDVVKIIVVDVNKNTGDKSGTAMAGFGKIMLAWVVVM